MRDSRPEETPELSPEARRKVETRFVWLLALAAGFIAMLPAIIAQLATPVGARYSGFQYNFDDHMVYAAWMRQAMEGRILFDNRFTTDPQPGLTFHLYFLVLGWIAKLIGITAASVLVRGALSVAFVWLAFRLIQRLDWKIHQTKLALALVVVSGGFGFALWESFGPEIERSAPDFIKDLLRGITPIDVWQPEAFVFPSMLTNGLFMASLCLILIVFLSFLRAEKDGKPVLGGALAFAALMNIHSYDALLVLLVMIGFLVMSWAQDRVTKEWMGRCLLIGAGAVLPALWFVYVLQQDAVFQARAATPTYSPNFRQIIAGYLLLILLAIPALLHSREGKKRPVFAVAVLGGVFLWLIIAAGMPYDGFFLNTMQWAILYGFIVLLLYSFSNENSTRNLLVSWAVIGLIAMYFPALFQRKLTMGLGIPWAILAAAGIGFLLQKQERSARNLATVLCVVLLSATSMRWFFREIELAKANVSNTTVHSVYLSPDTSKIVDYLNEIGGRKVVVAMPGVSARSMDASNGQPIVDSFDSPVISDLNPVVSGFAGAYTYAGHWSETPNYDKRRGELTRLFSVKATLTEQTAALDKIGADYVIQPDPVTFGVQDLRPLGEVVVTGTTFSLVKLRK